MAKRFTDTDKWKKPFIRGLQGAYKLLWLYILDDCNHAGIWTVELDIASIRIGETVVSEKALLLFKNHVVVIDDGGKWFIQDFVDFQYGVLNPENRAHKSVIDILKKYDIKGLIRSSQGRKVKDMVKDMVMDKDKDWANVTEFLAYFNLRNNKNLTLTKDREKIIRQRLSEHTIKQLKTAVDNFITDDWQDRHKFCDIIYCIGIRNKIDNLEKWLNHTPKIKRSQALNNNITKLMEV